MRGLGSVHSNIFAQTYGLLFLIKYMLLTLPPHLRPAGTIIIFEAKLHNIQGHGFFNEIIHLTFAYRSSGTLTHDLVSLNVSFLICKMGIMIPPSLS